MNLMTLPSVSNRQFRDYSEKLMIGEQMYNESAGYAFLRPSYESNGAFVPAASEVINFRELVTEACNSFHAAGESVEELKTNLMMLYENTKNYINYTYADETTKSVSLQNLDKYIFSIITAVVPNLGATRMVSTQAMTGPQSVLFYMDYTRGSKKGASSVGDKLYETSDPNYASEVVQNEQVGTGNNSVTRFQGVLMWKPVRPGTVTITDGVKTVTDNGSGAFTGDVATGNNTINYNTGQFDVTLSAAPGSSVAVLASYSFDSEGTGSIPTINAQVVGRTVQAQPHPLNYRWSVQGGINLMASHKLSLSNILATVAVNEVLFEIDQSIVRDIELNAPTATAVSAATGGSMSTTWYRYQSHGSWVDHRLSIADWLSELSTGIEKYSGRGIASWFTVGGTVSDILENHPGLAGEPIREGKGVKYIGRLNGKWNIMKDTEMSSLQVLGGFKSSDPTNAAYIYAPFILAMASPEVTLDDLLVRRALFTAYAKVLVNAKMFVKGNVTNSAQP